MGLNVGGIFVRRAEGITQLAVRGAIRDYWLKIGASPSSDDPRSFEPLELAKTGRLAYLVTPATPARDGVHSWIAVCDSERYRADPALARFLAARFATEVLFYEMTETVNRAYAKSFRGDGGEATVLRNVERVEDLVGSLPYGFLYFNQVDESVSREVVAGFEWLALENVPHRAKAIYSGPSREQLLSNDRRARAVSLAERRDVEGLKALASDRQVLNDVIAPEIERADLKNPNDLRFVRALAETLLEENASVMKVAEAALRTEDDALFERALARMTDSPRLRIFAARALTLGQNGEPLLGFRILEAVTRSGDADATAWNNALYFLLQVIERPGIPVSRISSLIEGASRTGPTNPFVFYNVVCAWAGLGETARALAAVSDAVKYGSPHIDKLRTSPDVAALRNDPRFAARLETLQEAPSIEDLAISRRGQRLLEPAIGLHLQFSGLAAAPAIAELLTEVHREFGAMFSYCRSGGQCGLRPTGKGKLTRDLNQLRTKQPENGFDLQYDSTEGEASDLRCTLELSSSWPGSLLLHLPIALSSDPDSLFERLVRYAGELPFACGHAGFVATIFDEGPLAGPGADAQAELARIVPDYLGLGFSQRQFHEIPVVDSVAPSWLTFLGKALVERLGGALPAPPAVVRMLPGGGAVIRAARRPFVGARSALRDLGALPQVVRQLEQLRTAPERIYGGLHAQRWKSLGELPEGAYDN